MTVILLVLTQSGKISFGSVNFLRPTSTTTVKGKTFDVIVVKKKEDLEIGLSKTNKLDENKGMLFIFDNKAQHAFWMKDMKFSIDIVFINDDKIAEIIENIPSPTDKNSILPIYKPRENANKVLEINAGLVKKYNIKVGDKVEFKNVT